MSRPLSMLLPAVERISLKDVVAFHEIQTYVEKQRVRILYGSRVDVRYAVTVAAYACNKSSQVFCIDALFLTHVASEVDTGSYAFDTYGISRFVKLMKTVRTDVSIFKTFATRTIENFLAKESYELASLKRKTEDQSNVASEAVYDLAHSLLIPPSELTRNP